jgi:hypothetical protein
MQVSECQEREEASPESAIVCGVAMCNKVVGPGRIGGIRGSINFELGSIEFIRKFECCLGNKEL